MERLICEKCGNQISNEFGVTLSYCTNCGAALRNFNSVQTLELNNLNDVPKKPKNKFWFGLLAGIFLVLSLIGGLSLMNGYLSKNETADTGKDTSLIPKINLLKFSAVSASEITEVMLHSWQHSGSLYSGEGSVESSNIIFRRDGSVLSTEKTNYDDGKKTDISIEKSGNISPEDFERLAESLVTNDFFDQTDSKERISESDKSLKVKYSNKEKEIKTSNINKDTPEIKSVLDVITELESRVKWNTKN